MARQTQPTLIGRLKTNDVDPERWEINVFRLSGGNLRYVAQKAVVVGKRATDGKQIVQLRLVNVDGTPV